MILATVQNVVFQLHWRYLAKWRQHLILLTLSHNSSLGLHYTVSKNDTDVAHYNFDANQPILIIFGR